MGAESPFEKLSLSPKGITYKVETERSLASKNSIFKSQVFYFRTVEKISWWHLRNQWDSTFIGSTGKRWTTVLWEENSCPRLTMGLVTRNIIIKLSHPVTQRYLQLCSKESWLLFQRVVNLWIIHKVVLLQVCRMQVLCRQGGFHTDNRIGSGQPDSGLRGKCVAQWQWIRQWSGDHKQLENQKCAVSAESPRTWAKIQTEKSWGLQWQWWRHRCAWAVWGTQAARLNFLLLSSVFLCSCFFLSLFFSFEVGIFMLYRCILAALNFLFLLLQRLKPQTPWVSEETFYSEISSVPEVLIFWRLQ